MNKLKRKAVYEAPLTEFFQVELEGVFCGSVDVQNPNNENGKIDAHEVNTDFNNSYETNFGGGSWD